jgi:glyoxylase-like metal-dependent hydrolase (beta-lactamase superfamily II)
MPVIRLASLVVLGTLARFDLRPADVTHVFLSHGDCDQVAVLASFENARVFMSADEEQMLNGKQARALGLIHNDPLKVKHERVRDGPEVRAGSATVRCLATPGHTPGSLSFLLDGRILYTGDNLRLERGRVKPFVSRFNLDEPTQVESIHRLARLRGVTLLLTAHTGDTRDVEAAFRGW